MRQWNTIKITEEGLQNTPFYIKMVATYNCTLNMISTLVAESKSSSASPLFTKAEPHYCRIQTFKAKSSRATEIGELTIRMRKSWSNTAMLSVIEV